MSALFYRLNRHYFADVSLSRWIQVILIIPVGILISARMNGYLLPTALLLLLFVIFTAASLKWRRQNYIQFQAQSTPQVTPRPLRPADKLPIFATGFFSVEGKHAEFTWLQGYYRTFATREHALICLVQPSRFALVGKWPEKEVGMWYVFFKDEDVEDIQCGEIRYAGESFPGIAVRHGVFIPKRGRFDRDRTIQRTVYIACQEEADLQRIVADLHSPKQDAAEVPIKQNGAGKLPSNSTEWKRIDG